MYRIEFAASVADDLAGLTARERSTLLNEIDEQLQHEPTRSTRRKKIIEGLEPPWQNEKPLWQLSVGMFRVFYDVNQDGSQVFVRAIREKSPHKTTDEIL